MSNNEKSPMGEVMEIMQQAAVVVVQADTQKKTIGFLGDDCHDKETRWINQSYLEEFIRQSDVDSDEFPYLLEHVICKIFSHKIFISAVTMYRHGTQITYLLRYFKRDNNSEE